MLKTQEGVACWPKLVPSNARSPPIGNAIKGTVRRAPLRAPVVVNQIGGSPIKRAVTVDRPSVSLRRNRSAGGKTFRDTAEIDLVAPILAAQR